MSERAPLLGSTSNVVPHHSEPSFISSCKYAILSSYFNVFLIFVPIALVASFLNWSDTVVFSLNFLAIIPLAKLLGLGELKAASADVSWDHGAKSVWRN